MDTVSGHSRIVKEFQEVLGLDPTGTSKVVLTMETGDIVTVQADQYVKNKPFEGLVRSFKKYKMVEIKEDATNSSP